MPNKRTFTTKWLLESEKKIFMNKELLRSNKKILNNNRIGAIVSKQKLFTTKWSQKVIRGFS